MMKTCFILIDYQNDFVSMDGTLSCKKAAIDIENNILENLERHISEGDDIIMTLDSHDESMYKNMLHAESKTFPAHCIKGTWGNELYSKVNDFQRENEKFIHLIEKDSFAMEYMDLLKIIEKDYEKIILAGVASNICVLQNAVFLYNILALKNSETSLEFYKNSIASFDEKEHEFAIRYMKHTLSMKEIS